MNNRYLEKIASAETEAEILKSKPSTGGAMLSGALAGGLFSTATGRPAVIPAAIGGLVGGAIAKSHWRNKHQAVEDRNPNAASPARRAALGAFGGGVVTGSAVGANESRRVFNALKSGGSYRPIGKGALIASQLAGMAGGAVLGHRSGTKAVDKYLARKNQE